MGILFKLNTGDSEVGGSAGVVDVAASCSGGLRFGGVGADLTSQEGQSFEDCSKSTEIIKK